MLGSPSSRRARRPAALLNGSNSWTTNELSDNHLPPALQNMGANLLSEPPADSDEMNDVARTMDAVRGIVRALRVNTRQIELQIGVSLAQLFVLQQVAERPAESLNDLAERTATHQSSVSVVVRRLVDHGLVSRRSSSIDKRRVQIALTPAGQRLLHDAPRTISGRLLAALEQFSPTEQRQLADLLDAWIQAAGISVTSAPMMGEDDEFETESED
jgi:DNA-binding MarR family transcriptional regulator